MIQKISIKNTATFDTEGVEIDNLKKINFIYGANGCGKTTISNVIASPDQYVDSSIVWSSDNKDDALVYNKAFREKNFGTNNIPGVFTLGQATKEQIEELEQKKEKLRDLKQQRQQKKATLDNKKEELKDAQEQFNKSCWSSIKDKYSSLFKEAFVGFLNSKARFAQKIIDSWENTSSSNSVKYDELVSRAKTLFGEMPSLMQLLPQLTGVEEISKIEKEAIWSKKIIGKADVDIAPFIERLGISDWVNYGKSLLLQDSEVCPFCQKRTIDRKFREDLEAYFDEIFILDSKKLKEISERYISISENISNQLVTIIENEKISPTKLNLQLFESNKASLAQLFAHNTEIISNKMKEPSRCLTLQSSKELIARLNQSITQTNQQIKSHNDVVNNFSKEKKQLIDDVWAYIIKENKDLIASFVRTKSGCERGISNLDQGLNNLCQQYFVLNEEIKEGNKNVTSVQASVDEINKTLSAYGFTNFSIVPVDEHFYQIKRENGEIANNTLSEGEITFITFLYFMQLVKGGSTPETANNDRVVVIDDPISSLDSTILFVVSSLIKEEIKKIKKRENNILQLILLTHNVYFHKEVSFIDGRTKKSMDTWFWILKKNNNKSAIQCYEQENPIQGSYELLWHELRNKDKISIITLQNTMRRIYEAYFKVLGKHDDDDDILQKFPNIQEKEICRSLLCWVNDGSHCVSDDFSLVPNEEQAERYLKVFRQVFEVTGHIQHYNMMMCVEEEC